MKEEAVKSLTDLQELNSNVQCRIISAESALTLASTLASKLFTNKFTDDLLSKQIPVVSRTLLQVFFLPFLNPFELHLIPQAYPSVTIPSFANGLVSKNLHCVLNIVNLFHEAIQDRVITAETLSDGEQNTELKMLIHNLLLVISNSKV